MINTLRTTLFDFEYIYQNPVDRQRAVGLMSMNVVLGLIWLLSLVGLLILPALNGEGISSGAVLSSATLPVILVVMYQLLRSGRIRAASWVFFLNLLVGISLPTISQRIDNTAVVLLLIIVTGASVLMDRDELFVVYLLTMGAVLFGAYNQSQNATAPITVLVFNDESLEDIAIVAFALTVWLAFQIIFSTAVGQIVNKFVQTRNRLRLLGNLPQRLRDVQNEEDVILNVLGFITDELEIAFAQIYLYDEQGRLTRNNRIGMGTRLAVLPADELQAQPNSAIARALREGQTYYVSLNDAPQRRPHFLPGTTFDLVIPLRYGDEIIGVLDIQSNQSTSPFIDDEVTVMELLAVRVASSLVHARELVRLNRDLSEQQALNDHLKERLEAYQNRPRQQINSDWMQYVAGRAQQAFGFDLRGDTMQVMAAHDIPPALRPALEAGEIVVHADGNQQVINVPVRFRDEVLGAMAFTLPAYQQPTDYQINMAQVVAQRLALALENVRLVEQSRDQAQRERRASELTNQLISQQDVEIVLELAAENFREALGAVYTHIYLEPVAVAGEETH